MRFHIIGADKESGEDIEIIVEAPTDSAARAKATSKGILVSQSSLLPDQPNQSQPSLQPCAKPSLQHRRSQEFEVCKNTGSASRLGHILGVLTAVFGLLAFLGICYTPDSRLSLGLSGVGMLMGVVGIAAAFARSTSGATLLVTGSAICLAAMIATTTINPTGPGRLSQPMSPQDSSGLTERASSPPIQDGSKLMGGVFVKLETGSSEILRGETINLLRPQTSRSKGLEIIEASETILRGVELSQYRLTETYRERLTSDILSASVLLTKFRSTEGDFKTEKILMLIDLTRSFYRVSSSDEIEQLLDLMNTETFIQDRLIARTVTDIDGKYVITDVEPGDYVLAAKQQSKDRAIYWRLPVSIGAGESVQLHLFNENASRVLNYE